MTDTGRDKESKFASTVPHFGLNGSAYLEKSPSFPAASSLSKYASNAGDSAWSMVISGSWLNLLSSKVVTGSGKFNGSTVGVAVGSGLALSVVEGVGVWVSVAVGNIVAVAEGAVDAPPMGITHAARLIVSRRVNIICLRMVFFLLGSFLNIWMRLYYDFLRLRLIWLSQSLW